MSVAAIRIAMMLNEIDKDVRFSRHADHITAVTAQPGASTLMRVCHATVNRTVFANGSRYVVLTTLGATVIEPPPVGIGNVISPVSGSNAREAKGKRIDRLPLPGIHTVDAMAAPATSADLVIALAIMIGDTTGRIIPASENALTFLRHPAYPAYEREGKVGAEHHSDPRDSVTVLPVVEYGMRIGIRGRILAREMRIPSVAFAVFVLVASCALSVTPASAAPGSADFYTAPVPDLESYAPGAILRREPVPQLDALGSRTERILYRSADPRDRAVAVSGLLITPTLAWRGPGPRPVIAYAPGSYGIADRCSGSSELGLTTTMPALLPLLAQGYQVVTTDYQGLGTPGEYEFLGRTASARALLDSARAAASRTDSPIVLYGYSAGGVASAAASELASTYAPDLSVVGAFVGAAPTDPVLRVEGQDGSAWAATMLYTIDGLIGAHPEQADRIRALFNGRGLAALDAALDFCNTDALAYGSLRSEDLTADGASLGALMTGPVLGPLTAANTIGFTAPALPVMIVQGVNDRSVDIEQSRLLVQRWRAAGLTDITVREFDFGTRLVPEFDHPAANAVAYPEVIGWIDRLVAGA